MSIVYQVKTSCFLSTHQSYWEEEWISSIYTAIFVCQNSNCEEHVVSSVTGFVSQEPVFTQDDRYTYTTTEYVCFYNPKFFQPTLHFFKIPDNCPEEIRNPLLEAFSITLLSPSSAANKVRVSIENLLNLVFLRPLLISIKREFA